MSSTGYHEPIEELSNETRDMHRAIVSLMEELEAVDWYNQRVMPARTLNSRPYLSTIEMRKRSTPPWCWSGSDAKTPSFPVN